MCSVGHTFFCRWWTENQRKIQMQKRPKMTPKNPFNRPKRTTFSPARHAWPATWAGRPAKGKCASRSGQLWVFTVPRPPAPRRSGGPLHGARRPLRRMSPSHHKIAVLIFDVRLTPQTRHFHMCVSVLHHKIAIFTCVCLFYNTNS